MGVWPQFRSPLDVGRLRGLDLRHGLGAVLVRGPDSRPRDAARPRHAAPSRSMSTASRDGLARLGAALAPLRDGVPPARRARDAAGRLRPHGRELRLRGRASSRAGTRRSFRPTSSPAPSTPASRWCSSSAIPLRDALRPRGLHHDAAPRRTWRKVMLATGLDRRLRLRHGSVHGLVQREHDSSTS